MSFEEIIFHSYSYAFTLDDLFTNTIYLMLSNMQDFNKNVYQNSILIQDSFQNL